jgi:hypothetical protein
MGQRCGCVGKECNCAIVPGRGVALSGEGSQTVPLEVTQNAPAYLRSASSNTTNVALSGSGVSTDPYLLGMDFTGTPESKPLSITNYYLAGTYVWTRPVGCTMIEVTCIGAGAGGSAGSAPTGGLTFGVGGLGGQGGGWTERLVVLPGYVTDCLVEVGYGGSPGTSSGAVGGVGFDSRVRINSTPYAYVTAEGGKPVGGGGGGTHPGVAGPVLVTDSRLTVHSLAGGGGGKGAQGNDDDAGAIFGGTHTLYNGMLNVFSPVMMNGAGDGGRGGKAFSGGALVAVGAGGGGYYYGGGGGGGRGGGAALVINGGTWTFNHSAGGAGAPGAVRIIAY